MIKYYAKIDREMKELGEPQASCWINISPPFSQEELEQVAHQFEIPLDFLTDSLDIDERSRYEREEDIQLIVVNTPILNDAGTGNEAFYITIPIGIILIPDHVLTITPKINPVLGLFLDNRVKNFNPANEKQFVLQLLEQNVFYFLNCLKKLNLKRNTIEKELYNSSRNQDLRQLLNVEKSLVYFVNTLSSNELMKMKM